MDKTLTIAKRTNKRRQERHFKAWQRFSPDGTTCRFCRHDHTQTRAFFSGTDDRDEQGFRIYGVVGRLDTLRPELSLRVGVYGHHAPVRWSQVFDGPSPGVRLLAEEPESLRSTT